MKSSSALSCWALVAGLASPLVQAFVPMPTARVGTSTHLKGAVGVASSSHTTTYVPVAVAEEEAVSVAAPLEEGNAPKGVTRKSALAKSLATSVVGVAAVSMALGGAETAEAAEPRTNTASARALLALEDVRWTTEEWLRIVTSGAANADIETSRLYAKDGVLWGTVSEEIRNTPKEIFEYFNFFANLPDLQVSKYRPFVRMVTETVAINTGYYTFSWQPEGESSRKVKNARYSFTYRLDPAMKTGWAIVDHHSSGMPQQPAELKRTSG